MKRRLITICMTLALAVGAAGALGAAATASAPVAVASDGVQNCSGATPTSVYAAEWQRGETPKGVRAIIENDQLAMCVGWLGDADPSTSVWVGIENQFGNNAIIQAGILENGISGAGNILAYAYGGCNGAVPNWRVLQSGSTAGEVEVIISQSADLSNIGVWVKEIGGTYNVYYRSIPSQYYSCWLGADNTEVIMSCEIKDPGSRCGGTTSDNLVLRNVLRQRDNSSAWTSWPMEDACNIETTANDCNINNTDSTRGAFFSDK